MQKNLLAPAMYNHLRLHRMIWKYRQTMLSLVTSTLPAMCKKELSGSTKISSASQFSTSTNISSTGAPSSDRGVAMTISVEHLSRSFSLHRSWLLSSQERWIGAHGEIQAVRGIDFEVGRGETFGFLGPNGAGKSTTIKMLCTLLRPSGGRAFVNGYDIERQSAAVRQSIGIVFQDPTLDEYLSAEQNLR